MQHLLMKIKIATDHLTKDERRELLKLCNMYSDVQGWPAGHPGAGERRSLSRKYTLINFCLGTT